MSLSPGQLARNEIHLTRVRPEFASTIKNVIRDASARGWHLLITDSYRSDAEQAHLYAIGRTLPGKQVTNASTAKNTPHGRGAAIDVAWVVDGRVTWSVSHWLDFGALVESHQLSWGGRFRPIDKYGIGWDRPHIEMMDWRRLPYPWAPPAR